MHHPPPSLLTKEREATAFLALRWNELFGKHTIDSFQARLCNLPVLVAEIQTICEHTSKRSVWAQYLPPLQRELKSQIESIHGRGWLEPFDHWHLEQLSNAKTSAEGLRLARLLLIENKFKTRYEQRIFDEALMAAQRLPRSKQGADTVLNQLATIALCSENENHVEANGEHPDALTDADHALGRLATIVLQSGGWESGQEMRLITAESLDKQPADWMTALLQSMRAPPCEYICGIEVQLIPHLGFRRLQTVFEAAGFHVTGTEQWSQLHLNPGNLFVKGNYLSTSPNRALDQHLRKCKPVVDMLSFYLANNAATSLPQQGWVGSSDEALVLTESSLQPGNVLVKAHAEADSLVIHALNAHDGKRFDDSVSSALDLHCTAMQALDTRTRFLNLWSALECMSSLIDGDNLSVFDRVKELVVPIVTWRKLDKISRYCAINLRFWNQRTKNVRFPSEHLPNSTMRNIPSEDVFVALCRPDSHPGITTLLNMAGDHCLLRHRIFQAWKEFHDPRALHKDIEHSQMSLEWHLARIYRARNLLVHYGIETPLLFLLCENLHYCVSTVLSRIIHGLSQHPPWTPKDAVQHWRMMGEYTLAMLHSSPHHLTLSHVLPNPHETMIHIRPWST
ncbi:hypothetical protein [Prosthecobacter sp.]|uniref:hypothetical protein n=1 Tax=Prosthecobacter sp. TaxID=1965333 RepID=UPI003784EA49